MLGVFCAEQETSPERDEMKRLFRAHHQVDFEPQMWYKERVHCDVRTKCADLYMLCERCYCSHPPSVACELKVAGKRKTTT